MEAWRIEGGIIGLAVGDALGAPFEFTSPARARSATAGGLTMSGGGPWLPGEWTDDTAMALCLAESIAAHGDLDPDDVTSRYASWLRGGPKDVGATVAHALTGVVGASGARRNAEELHRATGRTAGNGTVMRAAPIGLALRGERAAQAAREDAALTHHDPVAGHASAALCAALGAIGRGTDPVEAAMGQSGGHPALERAIAAAGAGDVAFLAALAGGPEHGACWTALAVGLYAVTALGDYTAAVAWAVALGRDTDTNAAVTGALVGCRDGEEGIPARWVGALLGLPRLREAARGLARVAAAG